MSEPSTVSSLGRVHHVSASSVPHPPNGYVLNKLSWERFPLL